MTGASLGYSGNYGLLLYEVGAYGSWWASTVYHPNSSHNIRLDNSGNIYPVNISDKYSGRAVRYAEYPVCA
ncbi:hypothetical protein IKE88_03535 [Candidatus Saccharibacteria bacterium]|nr:hypothetical protein [Candidatus Saccharibacteria bacterium]